MLNFHLHFPFSIFHFPLPPLLPAPLLHRHSVQRGIFGSLSRSREGAASLIKVRRWGKNKTKGQTKPEQRRDQTKGQGQRGNETKGQGQCGQIQSTVPDWIYAASTAAANKGKTENNEQRKSKKKNASADERKWVDARKRWWRRCWRRWWRR